MSVTRSLDLLPSEFERFGFSFRQVHRTPVGAVYEVRLGELGSIAYEVVRPNISKQRNVEGTWTPCSPYEAYPSSEQWGSRGWTFVSKDDALEKCETIKK